MRESKIKWQLSGDMNSVCFVSEGQQNKMIPVNSIQISLIFKLK